MGTSSRNHLTPIQSAIREFLLDRQSRRRSPRTIDYYTHTLDKFGRFLDAQGVTTVTDITPSHVRLYLVTLQDEGRTDGGIVTQYRGPRAFLRWLMAEYPVAGWDPLRNVTSPKAPKDVLPPLPLGEFGALLESCEKGTFHGDRDRALLLMLLDTGIRWEECANLTLGDVNLDTGAVTIQKGKGNKRRTVFVGVKTRRALLVYFRERGQMADRDALWVKANGDRLTKDGVRQVKRRAAEDVGIPEPGMHAFRRAFAVNALRNGMDVVSIQRLLGHSDLSVILRYLSLEDEDLKTAQKNFGVIDNL